MDAVCKGGQCVGKPVDTSSWTDNGSVGDQYNFPTDIVNAISSGISSVTGVTIEIEQANIQGKSMSKTCCKEDTGPITNGETEASNTLQLIIKSKDIPLGPGINIDKTLNLGITKVQLLLSVGIKFGADIQLNGEFGGKMNQCEPDMNCSFGQADVTTEPSLYGVAEAIACADLFVIGNKCVGGGVKLGIKFALSAGLRYNKPDCNSGLQGFISAGPPTLFITAELDLPSRFEVNFQYQVPALMVTCSFPGGCH
jgi:hypothetical protein